MIMSPPPSPTSPPGVPGASTFTQYSAYVTMTCEGSVEDFDTAKLDSMAALFAASANVSASAVTMTVGSASVFVTAKIVTADDASAQAAVATLETSLATPAAATTFFASASITVVSTPSVVEAVDQMVYQPPPPPPSSPDSGGGMNGGAIAGAICGPMFGLIGLGAWYQNKKKNAAMAETDGSVTVQMTGDRENV